VAWYIPIIGHLKTDHRMDRCYLKGSEGDVLHAVLCAAGYNIELTPRSWTVAVPPTKRCFSAGTPPG